MNIYKSLRREQKRKDGGFKDFEEASEKVSQKKQQKKKSKIKKIVSKLED